MFWPSTCAATPPRHDIYLHRINQAFDRKVVVALADEGENNIVFACKGLSCPPKFSTIAEHLRLLEHQHPADLGQTAQKILGPSRKRHAAHRRGS